MIDKWIKWFISFNGASIPFAVRLCWKTPQRQSSWSHSFKNNFAFSAQDFKVKRKRYKQVPISWLFFSGIEGFWLSVFKPIATWQLTGYIFIAPAWLHDDKSILLVFFFYFCLSAGHVQSYNKHIHAAPHDLRYLSSQGRILPLFSL